MCSRFVKRIVVATIFSLAAFQFSHAQQMIPQTYTTVFNSKLYYTSRTYNTSTYKNTFMLNEYDGTSTKAIKTFEEGAYIYSQWDPLTAKSKVGIVAGDNLYILVNLYTSDTETYILWSYDGSSFTEALTWTATSSNKYKRPQFFIEYNDKLYFTYGSNNTGGGGYYLYSYDIYCSFLYGNWRSNITTSSFSNLILIHRIICSSLIN